MPWLLPATFVWSSSYYFIHISWVFEYNLLSIFGQSVFFFHISCRLLCCVLGPLLYYMVFLICRLQILSHFIVYSMIIGSWFSAAESKSNHHFQLRPSARVGVLALPDMLVGMREFQCCFSTFSGELSRLWRRSNLSSGMIWPWVLKKFAQSGLWCLPHPSP